MKMNSLKHDPSDSFTLFIINHLNLCVQIGEGVKPTLAELEKFEDAPEGMQVECILTNKIH